MLKLLEELKNLELISYADYYFARFISRNQHKENYSPEVKNLAIFIAALCHYEQQKGHTCVKLTQEALKYAFDLRGEHRHYIKQIRLKFPTIFLPDWENVLSDHIAFTTDPLNKEAPIVLQFDSLYLYRTWQDEYRIAEYFLAAAQHNQENKDLELQKISQVLTQFFPAEHCELLPGEQYPWQKLAVATAIRQNFCVITGGPGTGKTTTVTRLLLALQSLAKIPLKIKLVAPTGKAAARLTESINKSIQDLQTREGIEISTELNHSIPKQAETIHRLLGTRYYSAELKYHKDNQLDIDVLVVDEASMIDLSLMAKLLQALKPTTKLILLGDKDQLSSVEAGAILAELSTFREQNYSQNHIDYLALTTGESLPLTQEVGSIIRDNLCHLEASRRFNDNSYIGQLAKAINTCNVVQSTNLFQQAAQHDVKEIEFISFDPYISDNQITAQTIRKSVELVVSRAVAEYSKYLQLIQDITKQKRPIKDCINEIFTAFNQVRFLTALRIGPFGSEMLNYLIAERLREKGLLHFQNIHESYLGKPIMVTQNDINVDLYNGDIGLYLMEEDQNGKMRGRYWFENGQSELASRLPSHELAFAMTVHKSQGSEFEHTFLILPVEPNPVLTKELIYTGITRAKKQLTVFASSLSWNNAVNRMTIRQSGLGLRL